MQNNTDPASNTHFIDFTALNDVLNGIRLGDNIVWQIDQIDDYLAFVEPFCHYARDQGKNLVYFRFAHHRQLIPDDFGAKIYRLDPKAGFEKFITTIHRVIEETGPGAYYVFDSYSELTVDCYSDRMLGNFFALTCPSLYRLETIAYFAILRNKHSYHATLPIKQTTQLFIDVYRYRERIYIHPQKVDQRYSPSMYLPHVWDGQRFVPIKQSAVISEVLTSAPWQGLQSASYRMIGPWDQRFMEAESMIESYKRGECEKKLVDRAVERIVPILISKEERIQNLVHRYMTPEDIIYIWKRMIGTGMIGGKAVGMLLARAILGKNSERWKALLEPHDSFFIGSDVFYSFLVINDCWMIRQRQKRSETLRDDILEARRRIMKGKFPDYILHRFSDMLDYFGQSPVIVRSSSLLEDNFGNAFAGKYDSVFCPSQGNHDQRLKEFLHAVRVVYASSMSEDALNYREKRGLLEQDEQMALLVQRVSGAPYGDYFFPHLAGVAFSFNPYVWNKSIDPETGMLRIVFGLGTRAVDRSDDDYTRVVALNVPDLTPEANTSDTHRYTQKRIDVLNLRENRLASVAFQDLLQGCPDLNADLFTKRDRELDRYIRHHRQTKISPLRLDFHRFFKETNFINEMEKMLKMIRDVYKSNVDVEFALNILKDGNYRINILQCRPLQISDNTERESRIPDIAEEEIIMRSLGGVIGQGRFLPIHRLVYVVPEKYGYLPEQDRYSVARLIGRIAHAPAVREAGNIILLGPGRWGTSMPSLGVPVNFHEIDTVSALCEIDSMHEGLVPDLSLGTHFFHEMVEQDILYIAHFKARGGNIINDNFLEHSRNYLSELFPEEERWSDVIRVIYAEDYVNRGKMYLVADSFQQLGTIFFGTHIGN